MRNVKNGDKVCVGYDERDLKRYMGADGPGDTSAVTPEAINAIRTKVNDTNVRQWTSRNLFITTCGSVIQKHLAGTPPPAEVTCLFCLGQH